MGKALFTVALLTGPTLVSAQVIPNDRLYPWQNAGLLSTGGIPTRTTICKTLAPGAAVGADDSTRINNAIAACPAGQVVLLEAGTFITKNYIQLSNSVTLRGAGAGHTMLQKPNGAKPRETAIVEGTTGIHVPRDPGNYNRPKTIAALLASGGVKEQIRLASEEAARSEAQYWLSTLQTALKKSRADQGTGRGHKKRNTGVETAASNWPDD